MATVRVKKVLNLTGAEAVMSAAEAFAREKAYRVVIAIVDPEGHPILVKRLPNTQVASVQVGIDKARTAAIFVRPSRELEAQVSSGRLGALALHGGVALTGGIPLVVDGEVVGAIIELLHLCAFLAPDAIPYELFTENARTLGPTLGLVAANEVALDRSSDILRERGNFDQDYPASVATTWSLSFEKVYQANPASAELLNFCAFLASDPIPETLITKGAQHLSPILRDAVVHPLQFDRVISALLAYSLLHREISNNTVSVHRLVQAILRENIPAKKQRSWSLISMTFGKQKPVATQKDWKQRAVQVVNASYPDMQDVKQWDACERWLPHALVCAAWIEQERIGMTEAAHLLSHVGCYLQKRARYAEAEPLFQRALSINVRQLGPQHPNTAASLINQADLYRAQGKYGQAEPLYQRALAIDTKAYGAEHPEIATDLNNQAGLYKDQGKYEQAEPLFQRALAIDTKAYGAEHPEVATNLNNLALLYWNQGKYEQAEPLYRRALAIREQQLGPNHPDTAQSLNNLAGLYWNQGKYSEVEPLLERALPIQEQLLGPNHPDTARSLNNLANLYHVQGRHVEAEPLFRRALAIREQTLGEMHPDTANSVWSLAVLSEHQRQYEQAVSLYQRALSICEHTLGPQHPTTQTIRANYASLNQFRLALKKISEPGWPSIDERKRTF